MIRVLIADDHGVIRDSLRYLLEAQGDIQVIGLAADGQEAVEHVMRNCPDVTVMDISMPRMDGMEATRQIRILCPRTRVVMLTIYNTKEHIRHAIQSGASGFVPKESAGQELVTAIRALYEGKQYWSRKIPGSNAPL
jgi:DNA-binding NarL/FixJ family response regulator